MTIAGTVQGVGYRPFVARMAARLGIRGWVRNDLHGVQIRACVAGPSLEVFTRTLQEEAPPAAHVTAISAQPIATDHDLPPTDDGFAILPSPGADGAATTSATPDLALCDDCRRELLDPENRRHGYPFINCTNCGPRYSILLELPYDRPQTTMHSFTMCPECSREYSDPADRRYHAQPNACPVCGPHLDLLDSDGKSVLGRDSAAKDGAPGLRISDGGAGFTPAISTSDPMPGVKPAPPPERFSALNSSALNVAAEALLAGQIVAVKGIGGFHLMVDATNEAAVLALRRRKHREEKPLAVLFPDLAALRVVAEVPPASAALLQSPGAPIVLLRRRVPPGQPSPSESAASPLAPSIAPGNPWIGALLPYSPLHHLLLARVSHPLVATSANLAEEPLCTDNAESLSRLRGIADLFLIHDRPIARPVDDSVLRPALAGAPIILRRARGYAPFGLPLPAAARGGEPLLCVGGHMKNTVALATDSAVVLSPHIGDLATVASQQAFQRHIEWLISLQRTHPRTIVCDAHPDYDSTRYARASGLPVTTVQHHLAHVFACLLEHPNGGPEQVLGVSWDGTGYGGDGTIWGGEFIHIDRVARTARRVACLRPFRLPGGDAAIRDPRRSALALLYELHSGEREPLRHAAAALGMPPTEAETLLTLLASGAHSPITTSAGRLFDGVASLLGLASRNTFEGQAAMQLEFAAERRAGDIEALPFALATVALAGGSTRLELDWRPALAALLALRATHTADPLAARFHRGLAKAIAAVSSTIGVGSVALTGGCFQNRLLLAGAGERLTAAGFTVLRHRELPPNDGNLAAGQALAARLGVTEVAG
ncbi:MAG: carbamoyltransferase HypF [Opitutaceae bacterium]|nr:carbamoyltransferase HypF [Opitutaceae bacterium]